MSSRTAVLSAAERERGFSSFSRHISWNGLGVFLLNDTIVSLMAIHFGASNLELGYINAAFHVTGVVSLVVPRLFKGCKITRLFGMAWMIRGFVVILYGVLFFLSGYAARVAIITIFTVFCITRAMGVSVAHAVQRDVMRDREMGGAMVRLNIRLAYSQFASQLFGFFLLSLAFFEGLGGLITIVYIGAVMNTVASLYLLKIPGRSVVEHPGSGALLRTARRILRHRHHVVPLLVHALGMGLHVLFAFQVAFLRRVLEMPDNIAILFTLVGAAASILANNWLKPFADTLGEKPLLIIMNVGLATMALVWAYIPASLPVAVYFLVGFFTFFFLRSLLTLKSAALVRSIPERDRVPYTSMANMLLGVVALSLGLAGGILADVSARVPFVVHEYSLTFFFTFLVALATAVLSFFLPDGRSLSLRETAEIVLSIRNLRAFLDANQLDFAGDPSRRESLLLSLERSPTPIAASRLRDRLRGPSVAERERVLRILFRSPRPELLEDILAEAADRGSYTRRDALFCLGAYPGTRSEEMLKEIARREEGREEGAIALKSLARLDCREVLPQIRRLMAGSLSPRMELDLAVAEAILDPQGPHLEELFSRAFRRGSRSFAETRFSIALGQLGFSPGFQEYLRSETMAPGRGMLELIEDASEFSLILKHREEMRDHLREGDWKKLWEMVQAFSRAELEGLPQAPPWVTGLARSIGEAHPPDILAPAGTLAGLYVFHHCLDAIVQS
ncbi:Predicted arabinose efflux permease, MFS family [Alkalispirochaeta americana]|uniref:Predicted arabinose efflux permease, MFS family n=1 Tax=Alkalispirochaeta americana TaxID=159291 RepID=A0A1N6N7W9_9SPIO|nr:MFS transporter [Alkalispirochaeta americana]SIP88146.1 Predicted arabinose efflux permease, MFS family [Alkalispirochaeta americana]